MTTPAAVLAALTGAEYRASSFSSGNGACVMVGFASLADAEYRTSSFSTGNGACVMVGFADRWVGLKDSKQQEPRPILPLTGGQFTSLLGAVRSGHLTS